MKVILVKEVPGLGPAGTVKEVREGYARNYLLPRGLAREATDGTLKAFKSHQKAVLERAERERFGAEQLAAALEQLVIEVPARAGEGGRLFGSVTAQDIADALVGRGHKVSKKQVELHEPIKSAGFYKVPVRLGPRIVANVDVNVVGTR